MAALPAATTEEAFAKVGRDEAALRPGLERLALRLGVDPAGLTRYAAGSRPVYASGDLVLKLFPPVAGWPDYRIEAEVLAAVRGALPTPTPRVHAAGDHDGWGYILMSRLPGVPLHGVWDQIPADDRDRLAGDLGETIAALHEVPPPEIADWWPDDWPAFVARQRERIVGEQLGLGLSSAWADQIPGFLDEVALPIGAPVLLHTEVMREHLLVTQDAGGAWRLAGLIDFEPAMRGDREYEWAAVGVFVAEGDGAFLGRTLTAYGYPRDQLDQQPAPPAAGLAAAAPVQPPALVPEPNARAGPPDARRARGPLVRHGVVSFAVTSPVSEIIDQLLPVMRRGDMRGFQELFNGLHREGLRLTPDQLTEAIELLAPILAEDPGGVFARLALVAGAYTEWGGSPLALAPYAPVSALRALRRRARFAELWPQVGGGRPEPDQDQKPSMDELIAAFRAAAGRLGLPEPEAESIALSWFDAPHWVNLLITVLADRDFRAAAGLRDEIAEAAAGLGDLVPRAHWLPGLARVLDNEPMVVIDHEGRHGFRLTMSGVGDNFQLHTLLADRLIGDPARGLMPGERPAQSWVAAATTAPPQTSADDPIRRRFRLFDGTGAYIYPEGVPADVSLTAGTRVIVLHPPRGAFGWINGRSYVHMVPELTLDQIMSSEEIGTWHARIAPARETDLFGAY